MACLTDLEVLHPRPGVAVVECTGEHDLTSKDEFERLLSGLVVGNGLVVVDVSEAKFIDSSFIHNLVKADGLARQRGSRFRLQHGTELIVRRALEVSGILTYIESVSTRGAALAPEGGDRSDDF
jgi:anti-anti-sigma factor